MQVNVHHAKTHLSKLIEAVEDGEEGIIARAGKLAVKMVLVTPPVQKSRRGMLGTTIGKIRMADDAFSPETDLEIERTFGTGNPELDNC